MLTTTDLLDWFSNSPDGQRIVTEREAAAIATREQMVRQLAKLRSERETAVAAENKAIAKAEAELTAKQDAAAEALGVVRQLKADRHSAIFRFDREVQQLERQLLETSDPSIDAFIAEMNAESRELSRESHIKTQSESRETGYGAVKVVTTATNLHSLRRRLAAIGEACHQAESLRCSSVRDIPAELAKLRESLPVVKLEPIKGA